MSKENDQNRVQVQNRTSEVYIRGMNADKGKEIVNTKEKVLGMTPSQALNNFFLDRMSDPQNGERFTNQLGGWVRQEGRTVKKDVFSVLESLAPTDSEIIKPWLLTVAEKSLVDRDRLLFQKTGKSTIDWTTGDNLKKYYALTSDMESKWDKLSMLGRNVEVHPDRLNKSELIRSQLEEGFLGIGDALFDFVSNATDLSTGKFAKLGIGVAAAEVLLAACTPKVTPTVEVAPMPGSGEAVPIGVLYAEDIALLPEGVEKDNLQREIDNVEEICGTIPNCIGGTEKIYRVATADTVYSMRFADFLAPGETVPHTKILSIMDGKTQESVDINKDLLAAKGVTLDGINTTGYYYYDDDGKEHFVMVEKEKDSGDQFIVYDTNGNYYDVVTQNEKEVRAYAHLWEEPGIVKAEALPTPTTEVQSATATNEALSPEEVINKNITEFLAGSGQFSDEALKDKHFIALKDVSEEVIDGLGIVTNGGDEVTPKFVEGVLLGANEDGENLMILFGTKSFNGNRIVIPLYIQTKSFDYDIQRVPIQFLKSNNLDWSDNNYDTTYNLLLSSPKEIVDLLNKKVGEVMLNQIFMSLDADPNLIKNRIIEQGGTEQDFNDIWTSWEENAIASKNLYFYLNKTRPSWKEKDADLSGKVLTVSSIDDLSKNVDYKKMIWISQLVFANK